MATWPLRALGPIVYTRAASSGDRALSSAVEHFLDMEGVTGSIPVAPTMLSSENMGRSGRRQATRRAA